MYIRFLIAQGLCRASLMDAVPVLAHWRLASLPRYRSLDQVESSTETCDLCTPNGMRNRDILLLLARLGLRAGDIVQIRLHDIEWKGSWIHVSGKSCQETKLPLTQEAGDAIVTYVRQARPRANTDVLFFTLARSLPRVLVPRCRLGDRIRRAGIKRPSRGAAHLLRHSLASSMLRQGASLQEISVLLRHRNIENTQIYANVDIRGLLEIAQPWPEPPSC